MARPPTIEELKRIKTLHIDVVNGRVYRNDWFEYCKVAGHSGRVFVSIGYRVIPRYHLIWWKATGKWPKETIDHKNRDSCDDRIVNLREATMSEQSANRTPRVKTLKPGQLARISI